MSRGRSDTKRSHQGAVALALVIRDCGLPPTTTEYFMNLATGLKVPTDTAYPQTADSQRPNLTMLGQTAEQIIGDAIMTNLATLFMRATTLNINTFSNNSGTWTWSPRTASSIQCSVVVDSCDNWITHLGRIGVGGYGGKLRKNVRAGYNKVTGMIIGRFHGNELHCEVSGWKQWGNENGSYIVSRERANGQIRGSQGNEGLQIHLILVSTLRQVGQFRED
ncbi:hypothetical protein EDD15DRAFT_2197953 [Pisolithus albus]|nr:hypothetical protein EDD15DRAFT_2197953 [Pisolithus albus]